MEGWWCGGVVVGGVSRERFTGVSKIIEIYNT